MSPDRPTRKPGGNIERPGAGPRQHDPRHMGKPPRDDRKPAGDETVSRDQDDVPDIDDKSRAPIPGVSKVKPRGPVD